MAPSILGLASAILGIPTITTFIQNLISALTRNSEYIENVQCTRNQLQEFEDEDLLGKMSILLTPTGYSDGSLNTVIPPYQVLPTELVPSIATIVNVGGTITQINGNSYSSTSDGTGAFTIRPKFDFATTSGKLYKLVITPIGTVTGTVNFDFYDGSTYLFQDYDFTTTKEVNFKDNGGVFGAFDGTQAYSVSNFTISIKEIQEADFDFSRGSSATRVNEQGLVEDVQILSGELVQNGNFEQIGSELVVNGDFSENGAVNNTSYSLGWYSGDGDINITNNELVITNGASVGGRAYATDGVNSLSVVTSGKIYKLVYTVTENNDNAIMLYHTGGAYVTAPNAVGTHTIYYKAGGTIFILKNNTANTTVKIDNVSVKEVGQNWTFETGWSMGDGKAIYDGVTTSLLQSNYSMTASNKYRATIQVIDTSGSGNCRFAIKEDNNTAIAFTTYAEGTITLEFTSPTSGLFGIDASSSEGSFDITSVSLIEVTDDTDLPRIDFTDGTGSLKFEPQRTNKNTYSEDFSSYLITPADAVSITPNYGISPSGELNSTRVVLDASSALYKFVAHSVNEEYSSLYVKGVSGETIKFGRGTVANAGEIFTLTGDWQRLEDTSTTGNQFSINTFSGVTARDIEIWGAQVEEGSYATSYIPTSGSSVTRSADVANNSGNADLFNDSEGVLYAEIKKDSNALDNAFSMITIGDALNNRLQIALIDNSNDFDVLVGSSSGTNNISSAFNYGSYNKIALSYNSSGFKVFHDGTLVGSDSNTISGLNLQELKFRFATNTSYDFYGDVKCVAVFKEALSNNDLELLTGEGYNSFAALAAAYNYNVI